MSEMACVDNKAHARRLLDDVEVVEMLVAKEAAVEMDALVVNVHTVLARAAGCCVANAEATYSQYRRKHRIVKINREPNTCEC